MLSITKETQSVVAAMDSLLQVAKTLPISGYDIVSAADIDLIGKKRAAKPSAADMIEGEKHEGEEKKNKRKMSLLFTY